MTEVYNSDLYQPEAIDAGFHQETPHLRRITMATFGLLGVPRRFLDVGCGLGQTIELARQMDVDATGVELHERPGLYQHDLRKPLPRLYAAGADMIFCFEVAEHLPPESSQTLLRSLAANLADDGVLVWTAAIVGQGGLGHINCQPKWWWEEQMWEVGLMKDPVLTASLHFVWSFAAGPLYHLPQNLNVFKWR